MKKRTVIHPNDPHTGAVQVTVAPADQAAVRQLCRDHILGRDERVARVLAYMSVISAFPVAQRLGDRPSITCDAAHFQDRNSSGPGMQAAHYLPGQILVGYQYPWDLIPSDRNPAITHLRSAFEATHDLPVAFNRADSQAEAGAQSQFKRVVYRMSNDGPVQIVFSDVMDYSEQDQRALTEVFRRGCASLYRDEGGVTLPRAFDSWLNASGDVYRCAVAPKVDKSFAAESQGNALAREQRELEAVILAHAGSFGPERQTGKKALLDRVRHEVETKLRRP